MKSPEAIERWVASTPADAEWAFTEIARRETSKWTHGYHRYPAKFIPQLTEKLMDMYPAAHINDPFVGSGTTLVSACARGIPASGTDINPLAILLTRVKCQALEPVKLTRHVGSVLEEMRIRIEDTTTAIVWPSHIDAAAQTELRTWFSESTLRALCEFFAIIDEVPDRATREFLLVCFSHILKTCSVWRQSSNKPYRDKTKVPTHPLVAFKRHCQKMEAGNAAYYAARHPVGAAAVHAPIYLSESTASRQPMPDGVADLIITSSPYVTSYEYADLHRLSALWLGYQRDKSTYIGTSLKRNTPVATMRSTIAQQIVNALPATKASVVQRYYIEMDAVFRESYRILKPGGRCCYVIGNTTFQGVAIRNAEVFAESLQHAGFKLERCILREIPWKGLPQVRDAKTGRFTRVQHADSVAYPREYILIAEKSGT